MLTVLQKLTYFNIAGLMVRGREPAFYAPPAAQHCAIHSARFGPEEDRHLNFGAPDLQVRRVNLNHLAGILSVRYKDTN